MGVDDHAMGRCPRPWRSNIGRCAEATYPSGGVQRCSRVRGRLPGRDTKEVKGSGAVSGGVGGGVKTAGVASVLKVSGVEVQGYKVGSLQADKAKELLDRDK